MANPVIARLENQFEKKTPAGYPTMPGYQPGSLQTNPYGPTGEQPYATAPTYTPGYDQQNTYQGYSQPGTGYYQQAPSAEQMQQVEASWNAPAADPVARGEMTYDDVITRTGLLLLTVVVFGALNWGLAFINVNLTMGLVAVGIIAGLVLAIVNSFKSQPSPALIIAYAAAEGLALGGISLVTEILYPGIVIQAVLATVAVFAVTLLLFKSGKVRYSSKMAKFTLIGLISLIGYSLISVILQWTGFIANPLDSVTVAGIPIGIVVGAFAILVGTFCLIGDFEVARQGVLTHQPKSMAWLCAFGIIVTVVWIYLEVLRLIQLIRN